MALYQQSEVREYLDAKTGELQAMDIKKTFTHKFVGDNFMMLFYDYIHPITGLKSAKSYLLLIELVRLADYNTGVVKIPTDDRKKLCTLLGITTSNFTTYIKNLKDCNLISGSNGSYQINPQVFWRGDLNERERLLKDCEFYAEFGFRKIPKQNIEQELKVGKNLNQDKK